MMNLNDMVLFAKVAEVGGISAAARATGVPKSKVSRRMAALETALNARLLERTTRAVQLTEMGSIFLQHCRRVVEESESAVESVHQMLEAPRGLLRISVSVSVGQYLIAPYLGQFCKHFPDVEVHLNLDNRRVDIITEGYDLVVRVGAMQDSSLMCKLIAQTRSHLCASPAYAVRYGLPKTVASLSDHKVLAMSNAGNGSQWFLENIAGKIQSVEIEPLAAINDFTALRSLVESGRGIAFIPEYVTRDALAQEKLVRVLPDWQSPLINYYVLYPSRKGLTKKAEVWIDFFSRKLKELHAS
ncbi:MAG: LysR family transcriptional regulator [Kordiimonadaceae bacterium]|nr:LysR family transcriptional regulator [Kordiimonadaceae bacterium]